MDLKKIRSTIDNSYVNLILRIILGSLFLFAAASKMAEPGPFAKEIANYRIMPDFFINFMAITLPWIEFICALFIITGIRLKSSSFIIGCLLLIFTTAIIIAMFKGLNINCGCHTKVMAAQVGWKKLFENTGLFLAALIIFYSKGLKITLEHYILRKSALARMQIFRNLN